MIEINEDKLAIQIQRGCRKSFEILYEKHSAGLYRHIFQFTKSKEASEDLLHEVFIRIVKKINFYKPKKGSSFKAWIYRIAANESIDYLRKNKNRKKFTEIEQTIGQPQAQEKEQQLSSEIIVEEKEGALILAKAINNLPTNQRVMMNLKLYEDLSYKEISQICGCTINAVKQALFKGRSKLKNQILELRESA